MNDTELSFVWDDLKNSQNKAKHGVSFELIRSFDFSKTVEASYMRNNELRTTAYGLIEKRIYCLVYTMRGPFLRVISLRKANKREERIYLEEI